MLDFVRHLTPLSALSYAAWRCGDRKGAIELALRSGEGFELPGVGSKNNDYGVAYEVFVHRYYSDRGRIRADNVKLVVDLGANVGFSVIYFLNRYPNSRVIAFEPHPAHVAQLKKNLAINAFTGRVDLYENAAGTKTKSARITDAASSSQIIEGNSGDLIPIELLDVFPLLLGKRIDVLKMDIEGGEYEIMADDRFARLDVGSIVMEWHSRGDSEADKRWCEDRLRSIGFTTENIFTHQHYGMLWATAGD